LRDDEGMDVGMVIGVGTILLIAIIVLIILALR
jgi:hypothetical protein